SYAGQQVLTCNLTTPSHLDLIRDYTIDVWSDDSVAVLNSPLELRADFQQREALFNAAVECEIVVEDLDAAITANYAEDTDTGGVSANSVHARADIDEFFTKYRTYADIKAKIAEWAKTYPDLFTDYGSIGKTSEGRDIPAFKIGKPPAKPKAGTPKPSIWLNGGIHAREWISPATVMFLAYALLTGTPDPAFPKLLDTVDFFFTPVSNPDGYVYTFTTDRMWRKNRAPNEGSKCIGVDLNRNWDEHWNKIGTGKTPCEDIWAGSGPFSEKETKALSTFVLTKIPNRIAGIDFHSFSQLILTPWGWTKTPPNPPAYYSNLGKSIAAAIKAQSGVIYTPQLGADLYFASGTVDDWMNAKAKMVGLTIELRDTGRKGFLLPASEIVPTGSEMVAGVTAFVAYVVKN
ncbi:putative carboxypeptidase precursor, partial [Fimicolochytrium jonesii]|uniref:putative carboxypeptidase precursor n=1 Tax=Fimicolochytrium jonesii TaxID=1396493 RepID=UPI0022FE7864